MKKLFTLGVLGLCMGLSAVAADKLDNESFYVVGTMNGWSYPETESDAAGWKYKLSDEDGDGVYTGAFEIPKGDLQFKLFATPGNWETAEYYGADYAQSNVYLLQQPYLLMLRPGYGSYNINVKNWEGGIFSISARWNQTGDDEYLPLITMEGNNQPVEILKPDNDAFYLVGEVTDWNIPTKENAAEWAYRLTDEDGDGVFTGEFELPAGSPSFSILAKPGTWDGSYGFYSGIYVFTDDTILWLEENGGAGSLTNWEGGKIKISVEWAKRSEFDEAWTPKMVLSGPDQPARPAFPDIFMIGDFNDWKLPTATDANGAMPFDVKSMNYDANTEDFRKVVDANELLKFGICQLDPTSGKYLFYVPEFTAPFTLYNYKYEVGGYEYQSEGIMFLNGEWSADADKEKYTVSVKDWKGGELAVRCVFYYDGREDVGVYGYNCPTVEGPQQPLYFLIETDGVKRLEDVSMAINQSCYTYLSGHDVSILLTSENSLDPSPENCWGIDTTLTEAGFDTKKTYGWLPMVKGGAPISMKFPASGKMGVFYMFSTTYISVSIDYIGGPFEADKIYICGDVMTEPDGVINGFTTPSSLNYDVYEKYWRLDEVEPGVFSKAYYVPEKDTDYAWGAENLPQFRFFSELLGWKYEASLGSAEEDFYCLPVDLSEGRKEYGIIKGGLGNWGMNSVSDGYKWEPSWVRIVVDTNNGTVSFEKVTSGVDEVGAEGEVCESWYNLQGVKVEKPVKGLYIHVRNGKSAVEMVK